MDYLGAEALNVLGIFQLDDVLFLLAKPRDVRNLVVIVPLPVV